MGLTTPLENVGAQQEDLWRVAPRALILRLGIRSRASLWIGIAMLGLLLVCSLAAPLLTGYSPIRQNPAAILQSPSASHWFGTDQYGRDVLVRTLYAGRIDFLIGITLVGVAACVGTAVGLLGAWCGGIADAIVMRLCDVGFAFPFLVLVIAIVGIRGPGFGSLVIAVSVVAWVFYARLVRAEVLVLKRANFVRAARVSGLSTVRILARHVLPNVSAQILIYASTDFVYAILLGASVSYLGLGIQPPTPEWGAMVQAGQSFITTQWWLSLFPGLAIVVTGIALALVGDGLAARLREGRR